MTKDKPPEYTMDNVRTLMEFGLPEQDAIDSLKACDNNVETSAEYYFNGRLDAERKQRAKDSVWNEGAFSQDRNGNPNPGSGWDADSDEMSWQNTNHFNIQGPDVPPPRSQAPSPADSNKFRMPAPPTPVSDTDEDLKKALQLSMQDQNMDENSGDLGMGGYGAQVTGITGTRSSPVLGPHFGPARAPENYDTSNWQMVPVSGQPPRPFGRARERGKPAFLRPNKRKEYIPGFLTIMHNIPAGRNALLALGYGVLEEYGYEPNFWNGGPIEIPKPGGGILDDPFNKVVFEVQRFMAFLDDTTRAYGSVETLPEPFAVPDKADSLSGFIEHWKNSISMRQAEGQGGDFTPINNIFSTVINVEDGEKGKSEFLVARMAMPEVAEVESTTFYDALDRMFEAESEGTIYFDKVGDILACQLDWPENSKLQKMALPQRLYLERYTESYLEIMDNLRAEKNAFGERMQEIRNELHKLTKVTNSEAAWQEYDGIPILKAIVAEYQRRAETGSHKDAKKVAAVNEVIARIEGKARALQEEMDLLYQKVSEVQKKYTSPEDGLPESSPAHYLCGLVTNPYTTFFVDKSDYQQWWRVSFSKPQSNQWAACMTETYSVETVSENDAFQAARDTAEPSVIAIYAIEEAFTKVTDLELPQGLKAFVQEDNAVFAAEQESATQETPPPSPPLSATTTSDSAAPDIFAPKPRAWDSLQTPQGSTGRVSPEPEGQIHRELEARNPDQMEVDGNSQPEPNGDFAKPTEELQKPSKAENDLKGMESW